LSSSNFSELSYLEQQIIALQEIQETQRKCATNVYGVGIYNGIELSVAVLEGRQPVYLPIENKESTTLH